MREEFIFRSYSHGTALVLLSIFVAASAFSDRSNRPGYQFGTERGSLHALMDYRSAMRFAVSLGDTMLAPAASSAGVGFRGHGRPGMDITGGLCEGLQGDSSG